MQIGVGSKSTGNGQSRSKRTQPALRAPSLRLVLSHFVPSSDSAGNEFSVRVKSTRDGLEPCTPEAYHACRMSAACSSREQDLSSPRLFCRCSTGAVVRERHPSFEVDAASFLTQVSCCSPLRLPEVPQEPARFLCSHAGVALILFD